MSEEGAPGAADGVEAVDEVEGRVQGHLGRPPAQLRGRGGGGGAVELPDEAGVGGAAGVEGLVGHRWLDPVEPPAAHGHGWLNESDGASDEIAAERTGRRRGRRTCAGSGPAGW